MSASYLFMIVAGLVLAAGGLTAMHRRQGILGVLAGLAVLAGTAVALLGTLLAVVPDFFRG